MNYTLTLDMRKEDIDFAEEQAAVENTDLSTLFIAFLRARAMKSFERQKAIRQREEVLSIAGGWKDSRSEREVIDDIESHRTAGREVKL